MSSWWADKLGQAVPPRSSNIPPAPPSQQPMSAMPLPVQNPQPNLPPSSVNASFCPDCRSKNYGSFDGAKPRCYDCGYPIRQTGSGLGKGISVPMEGPTKAAVQVPTGGWNPGTIIGKL